MATTVPHEVTGPMSPEQEAALKSGSDSPAPGNPEQGDPSPAPKPEEGEKLYAGKYKSVEEMEAAYKALEAKLGAPAPKPEEGEKGDDEAPAEEEAREALTVAGLDMGEFEAEFAKDGKLSDDSYKKLAAAGFPKAAVDAYIRGRQAEVDSKASDDLALKQADASIKEIHDSVGGKDEYTKMVKWAAQNLSQPEQATYDRIMDSGDLDAIKWAVAGLRAKYDSATGQEPDLIGGEAGGADGPVFRSTAELTAAMSDPRYKNDSAYRADVAARLKRSNIFKK